MSIARHDGRTQLCCDACPAALPDTYPPDDFAEMIHDAREAGWRIEKRMPKAKDTTDLFGRAPRIAGPREEPYTHICPACARRPNPQGALL